MTTIPNDPYDPCEEYAELIAARKEILSGGGAVKRTRFRNGEDERETEFSTVNIKDLEAAIARARRDCMATQEGARPSRHAIGIGHMGPPNRII